MSQDSVDLLYEKLRNLPFFDGVLYSKKNNAILMMVFLDPYLFNSEDRGTVVEDITKLVDDWSQKTGVRTYISGLPFVRIQMTNKVKGEIGLFIGAALLVTFLLLLLFFRNFISLFKCCSNRRGVVCRFDCVFRLPYNTFNVTHTTFDNSHRGPQLYILSQ